MLFSVTEPSHWPWAELQCRNTATIPGIFWATLPLCSIKKLELNIQRSFSLGSHQRNDCLWLLLKTSLLFTSAPPSSNKLMFRGSHTYFAPEGRCRCCLMYWGLTHSMPRNKLWDYCKEEVHRKCAFNSSALWILPSSLAKTWKYFQIFTAENTFCSCAHTYLVERCLCLLEMFF